MQSISTVMHAPYPSYFENITAMIGFKYISYCTTEEEEEEAGKTSCM